MTQPSNPQPEREKPDFKDTDFETFKTALREVLMKTAGGVSDMAEVETAEILQLVEAHYTSNDTIREAAGDEESTEEQLAGETKRVWFIRGRNHKRAEILQDLHLDPPTKEGDHPMSCQHDIPLNKACEGCRREPTITGEQPK